jgi:hypothetical protein
MLFRKRTRRELATDAAPTTKSCSLHQSNLPLATKSCRGDPDIYSFSDTNTFSNTSSFSDTGPFSNTDSDRNSEADTDNDTKRPGSGEDASLILRQDSDADLDSEAEEILRDITRFRAEGPAKPNHTDYTKKLWRREGDFWER